jgi:hypothetical protein
MTGNENPGAVSASGPSVRDMLGSYRPENTKLTLDTQLGGHPSRDAFE